MTHKTPIALLILALLLLCEAARLFQIGGITPNTVLIFFGVLFTGTKLGRSIDGVSFSMLLLFLIIGGALLFHFWFLQVAVLSCIVAVMYFARHMLIGTPLLDLLLFLTGGTILFYGTLALAGAGPFFVGIIVEEIGYTAALGVLVWLVVRYVAYARRS